MKKQKSDQIIQKDAKLLGKRSKSEQFNEDKNEEQLSMMSLCRSPEAGRPLFVHMDTLSCCISGCIACAYKIVVQPHLQKENSGGPYAPNVRPELCLRKMNIDAKNGDIQESR